MHANSKVETNRVHSKVKSLLFVTLDGIKFMSKRYNKHSQLYQPVKVSSDLEERLRRMGSGAATVEPSFCYCWAERQYAERKERKDGERGEG